MRFGIWPRLTAAPLKRRWPCWPTPALPIQSAVDKITLWFVPAVIALAIATFAVCTIWGPSPSYVFGLVNAVAVLIIACPCAMGLATPTSIMVGTGRAAELGVLFRKSEALQQLRDVKTVAFDKTGTLTMGKPVLTDLILDDDFTHDEVLALIAAVEAQSEHPIGSAIVAAERIGWRRRGTAILALEGQRDCAAPCIAHLLAEIEPALESQWSAEHVEVTAQICVSRAL